MGIFKLSKFVQTSGVCRAEIIFFSNYVYEINAPWQMSQPTHYGNCVSRAVSALIFRRGMLLFLRYQFCSRITLHKQATV